MIFGQVEAPWWNDKPVVIAGNGPSEEGFDYEQLKGKCYLLAVKGKMFNVPSWTHAGVGIDVPRYKEWADRIAQLPFPVYWGASQGREIDARPNVIGLERSHEAILSNNPKVLAIGGTSGYSAINLAFLKKAREIYLVGYDYSSSKSYWHSNEENYRSRRGQRPRMWKDWAKKMAFLKRDLDEKGVVVWNASPDSVIEAFPKITLEEMMELINDRSVR